MGYSRGEDYYHRKHRLHTLREEKLKETTFYTVNDKRISVKELEK